MGALLESDVFCTYRTHRSKPSHYQRPIGPSLTARGLTTRHLSGVGTSRSALLLTVRVESGIARTKSNNGPRSWLCSFLCAPDTLLLQDTKLYHVNAYIHTTVMLLIYPHLCDHPLLSGWEREEWQAEEVEEEEEEGFDRNGHLRQA